MEIKPIKLLRLDDLPPADETRALQQRFDALSAQVNDRYRALYGGAQTGADAIVLLATVGEFLQLMIALDREYGADAALPIADAATAADDVLRCLAELDSWLPRLNIEAARADLNTVVLGVGLWAMRHECGLRNVEIIVNALAEHANSAQTRQDVAASYGMMQGFIEYLAPVLGADLERSNPQRPWRLLNLNFAIAAIRTGDEMLMRYAFGRLNANLPDERAGFYAEALQLAEQAGLPGDIQAVIRGQAAKSTKIH